MKNDELLYTALLKDFLYLVGHLALILRNVLKKMKGLVQEISALSDTTQFVLGGVVRDHFFKTFPRSPFNHIIKISPRLLNDFGKE